VWLKSGASKRQAARLTKCSLTVAVTQQSWRGGNLYLPRPASPPAPTGRHFERPHPGGHNLRAIDREISPTRDSLRVIARPMRIWRPLTRRRELQSAIRAISPATDSSIALRAMKITTPDINRVRSDRVIFVRPALFARVFVTR
jgi:hypothetical protein